MANRPVFLVNKGVKGFVVSKNVAFDWFPGFSVSQKQKSIHSLHENIKKEDDSLSVLEVSSKSNLELGVKLSAFNLLINTRKNKKFSVETAFQASKVFEQGGPFLDLYNKTSLEAKKDPRIKNNGTLIHFDFFNEIWDLEPKTLFYDWLYINALALNKDLAKKIIYYNAFTDIEFNPKKSVNCQARSAALYVSLHQAGILEKALKSIDAYKDIVIGSTKTKRIKKEKTSEINIKQLSIFDELD